MHLSSPACIKSDWTSTTWLRLHLQNSSGFDHRCQKQAVPSADCIWGKQVRFLALETPQTPVQLNLIEMSSRWNLSNDCISLWTYHSVTHSVLIYPLSQKHIQNHNAIWDGACVVCCRQLPLCTSGVQEPILTMKARCIWIKQRDEKNEFWALHRLCHCSHAFHIFSCFRWEYRGDSPSACKELVDVMHRYATVQRLRLPCLIHLSFGKLLSW